MSSPEGLFYGQQASYTPKKKLTMEHQPFEDVPPTENDEVLIYQNLFWDAKRE